MDGSTLDNIENATTPRVEGDEITAPTPSITLVLPASEDDQAIVHVTREASAALSRLTTDYEILVVDDGSLGANAAQMETVADETEHVRLVRQPGSGGYGVALRRGLAESTKQLVCVADANGQFELSQIDRLVLLARDYNVVCGYRIERPGPTLQRIGSGVFDVLARALLGTRVRDCNCAFKMFSRETVDALSPSSESLLVHAELLDQSGQLGKSIVEVGVTHRSVTTGDSRTQLARTILLLFGLLRYWWSRVAFPNLVANRDDPGSSACWAPKRRIAMTLLLVGLCLGLYFTNLNYSLIEPDETRYAQIALEMQESGDWVVPRLFGEPYLDKPPLLYWMAAASYSLFGASDWPTRLPTAFCATLSVLVTYLLGRCLIGDRAAWFGALAVLLSSGFVLCARFLIMDGPLTLFTTLTLLIAANAVYRQSATLLWWIAAGVTCGIGMLVKGPIAAVICVPPLLAVSWLGTVRHSRWRMCLAILVPCVVLTVPWFILVATRQQEFAGHFFWKHHVLRFWNAFDHQAPWWYYLPVLVWGMFPTSLLLPALALHVFSRDGRQRECRSAQLGFLVASGSWIVIFFSLSSCKLPTYILPAVPMLCLAIGKMLDDTVWAQEPVVFLRRYAVRTAWLVTLLLPVGAVVFAICDLLLGSDGALVALAMFGLMATVTMIGVAVARYQPWTVPKPWFGVSALCLIVGIYGFAWVFPQFANWRSRARAAATLKGEFVSDVPVVFFGQEHFATHLELDKEEIVNLDRGQLDDFGMLVAEHSQAVVVTRPFHAEQIREECGQWITLRPSSIGRDLYVAESKGESAGQVGKLDPPTRR